MGESVTCLSFFDLLETGDWIELLSIVVNSFLAYWIVSTIQNKLTNQRVLKDHFINEIKDLRLEYKKFLMDLHGNRIKPHSVAPWFKLMNIRVDDLMNLINQRYKIKNDILKGYQFDLRELVTNDDQFISNYINNREIHLSSSSKNELVRFQQQNQSIFNSLIVLINDFD